MRAAAILLAAVIAGLVGLEKPALANPSLTTEGRIWWGNNNGWFGPSPVTGGASLDYSDGYNHPDLGSYSGHAVAQSGYGVLHAYATGSANSIVYNRHLVYADAMFTDDLTFAGGSGSGSAYFAFTVSGSASGDAFGQLAMDSYSLGFSNFATFTSGGTFYSPGVGFTFGTSKTVGFRLNATFYREDAMSSSGTADFGSTATLTGIQVFDANGQPVANFGLTAASGASYPLQIPEPGTLTLLILGGITMSLAFWRRRRRASRIF